MSYNVIAMKKVYSLIALAASVVIAAISCSKEVQAPNETIEEPSTEVSQVVPDIHFNAISNGQIDPAETKTAAVIDGDETYVKWLSTDRLIIVESATKAGSTTVNSIKTSGAPSLTAKDGHDDVVASFGATVSGSPVDGAEDYIYTAIYPSVVVAETETNLVEKTTPGTYRLNFPSAQHLQGNNLSSDSDLLISTPVHKGTTRVVEDEDLEFRYKRIGTLVKLTLKGLTASETIQSVTVTAPKNIAGFINVNPAEGSYETAPYYNQSTSVILTVDDVTTTGNDIVWFRVLPGAWESGQTLQVVVETDKATYSRTTAKSTAIALTKNLEFVDGGLTKLAVNMATRRDSKDTSVKYDITSSTSEIDDEATYLITSTVEGKTYAMASHSSNSYYGKVDMLSEPVAGVLSVTTEEVVTVNFIAVSGEDGKYYVKDSENNYVGCSSAKTLLFNSTFATIKDNDSYKWEISYSAGTPTLSSSAGDLKYNSSAPRFLTYASGQKDISIYVQRGTLKADPELRFLDDSDNEVSSINLAWDDRGTFSAPTLANPYSVSVAYTSSNTAAVSVDSEGNLTINGGGTATITATSIASATYRVGTASYKIKVTGAPVAVETINITETWSASLKDESGNNTKFVTSGDDVWTIDAKYGRKAQGNGEEDQVATLYSPKFNLSGVTKGTLKFTHIANYFTNKTNLKSDVQILIKKDDGEWSSFLSDAQLPSGSTWDETDVEYDLSAYVGHLLQFKVDYTSSSARYGTYEINTFSIDIPVHSVTATPATDILMGGDAGSTYTITIESNYNWTASFSSASVWGTNFDIYVDDASDEENKQNSSGTLAGSAGETVLIFKSKQDGDSDDVTSFGTVTFSDGTANSGAINIKQSKKGGSSVPAGTVLWAETWTGATTAASGNDSATPSANYGIGTTVYNSGTVTYSQSANTVYVRNEELAGGTKPELMLSSGKTWTIADIPTGGAAKLTLTYASNNTKSSVTCSTTGAKISGSSKSYTITTGGADTITLVFGCSGNTRIDDVSLVVAPTE